MLEGQYAEICPLKGAAIGLHWNACTGRLKQARKFPGVSSGRSRVTVLAGPVPARETRDAEGQSGLRSCAPSFDLANHREIGDHPPLTKSAYKAERNVISLAWLQTSKTV